MAIETITAMHVKDEPNYEKYIQAITPILKMHRGFYRYDFVVNKVWKAEAKHKITRVFALNFPDQETREKFFADPAYLAAREKYFVSSVGESTQIAQYTI